AAHRIVAIELSEFLRHLVAQRKPARGDVPMGRRMPAGSHLQREGGAPDIFLRAALGDGFQETDGAKRSGLVGEPALALGVNRFDLGSRLVNRSLIRLERAVPGP